MQKKTERNKYLIFYLIFFLFFYGCYLKIINYEEKTGPLKICTMSYQDYTMLLTNYLERYNVSVSYLDINTGVRYNYQEDKVYYAASTIKTLSAMYMYEMKRDDLDKTLVYESKYIRNGSLQMQEHKIGEEIKIRDLVKYTIMVSDNTAYNMIVNYIGKDNLREYGLNLGARYTLNLKDNYGSINTLDSVIYLKKLYELIKGDSLGEELKNYFVNSEENYLRIEGYEVLAKYGYYEENFHLIGIVLTPNPYIVSILTLYGKDDYQSIIKDINNKIYTLHNLYNQKSNCK